MKLRTLAIALGTMTLATSSLSACGQSEPQPTPAPETAQAAPAASAPKTTEQEVLVTDSVVVSAQFSGRSDHITTGTATITGVRGGYVLILGDDFSLDGAPDPVVGFGQNGQYNPATKVGSLTNITGRQTYLLPADFEPAASREVYIWCEQFDVPLGVASFAPPFVATGTFEGRSEHITTGRASIIGEPGDYKLVFAADFSLDGAPDPVVGFGNNGVYNTETKISSLTQIKGTQSYSLPADFDPSSVSEVYVWCEKFGVPLGVATLSSAS